MYLSFKLSQFCHSRRRFFEKGLWGSPYLLQVTNLSFSPSLVWLCLLTQHPPRGKYSFQKIPTYRVRKNYPTSLSSLLPASLIGWISPGIERTGCQVTGSAPVSLLGYRTGQRKEEGSKGPGLGGRGDETENTWYRDFPRRAPPGAHEVRRENTVFLIFGFIYFSFVLLLFLVSLVYLLIILICMDVFTLFAVFITWKWVCWVSYPL